MSGLLDEALLAFQGTDPEWDLRGRALVNHGTMASEALIALARPEAVAPFMARYQSGLRPFIAGTAIPPGQQAVALGISARMNDWIATFEERLQLGRPTDVLEEWLPRLMPGVMAASMHGLLRVAHALRALGEGETPPRRRELAFGLGLWAARYQPLPQVTRQIPSHGSQAGRAPLDVLATLPLVPAARRKAGLIHEVVDSLGAEAGFAPAVAAANLRSWDLDRGVVALTGFAARGYLESPAGRFGFLHAITATSALRLFASWVDERQHPSLLAGIFPCVAAIQACYAPTAEDAADPAADQSIEGRLSEAAARSRAATDIVPDDLATRAARTADDHAIKLTEVALREHRLRDRFDLIAAAAREVERCESEP